MKILYIILFSADTLLLVILSFLLLKLLDKGAGGFALATMIAGILASIILLVFFLYGYLEIPNRKNHK